MFNCGGKALVLDLLNSIVKHFLMFTRSLFLVQKTWNFKNSCCRTFSSLMILIHDLSLLFNGLGLSVGSCSEDTMRFTDAAWVESSTNLTCIPLFPDRDLRTGGLKQAPLNLMMKRSPPSKVPAEKLPGSSVSGDRACLYARTIDLPVRYE